MRRFSTFALAAAPFACLLAAAPAGAQEKYIGETFLTAANYCPRGSLPADGRSMEINSYTALFSLLGTTYGGDGRTTFALPDLQVRAPVAAGRSTRGGELAIGESIAGAPGVGDPGMTDSDRALPAQIVTNRDIAPEESPETVGPDPALATPLYTAPRIGAGLAMTWCVAVEGIYPARN
ncbi:MAG: tail fiber protein [Maricaulaceae bacterium]|jgi:microcystin-dependent protein